MAKTLRIVGFLLLSILLLFFIIYSPVIFQEGNPIPVAYGIVSISVIHLPFVKIGTSKYLIRANEEDSQKLIEYLARNNMIFVDRMGSGWLFKDKTGKRYTAESRMYSTYFEILDIREH